MSEQAKNAFSIVTLFLPALQTPLFAADDTVITDLTDPIHDRQWTLQDDSVMGGRSVGGFETQEDHLYFIGNTNTNGGGFSSIR